MNITSFPTNSNKHPYKLDELAEEIEEILYSKELPVAVIVGTLETVKFNILNAALE